MTKIPKWVFLDGTTGEVFCDRCGQREKMPLPMPISSMVKWCEYFGDKHKFCKVVKRWCLDCARYEPRPSSTSCALQFGYPSNDKQCPNFLANGQKE